MIISHRHKFIFIKTEKTAGTSIEIALSKFCGEGDVITPISPEDEETRRRLGYRGPQNYLIPFGRYSARDWIWLALSRRRVNFFNHASASFIRRHIDEKVWKSYFKFCFERNPWDKVVSFYFWMNQSEPRPDISSYIQSGAANKIKAFNLYTIRGEIAVDKVFFYERLEEEIKEIAHLLGLPEMPQLPRAKAGSRIDKRHYREILNEEDRQRIAAVYFREIAQFGYEV